MTTSARWLLLVCLCSVGCYSSSGNGPQSSGNTNWLELCTTSSSCDADASCLCGVCTRTCDESAECGSARCSDPGSGAIENGCAARAMGEHAGVCLRACRAATDCPAGQVCEDGGCVARQQAVVVPGSPQESVPSDACDDTLASCDVATLDELIDHSRKASTPADPNARVWSCEGGGVRIDPAGYDEAFTLAVVGDSPRGESLFIGGVATAGSDGVWRIERRAIGDLSPEPSFGVGGAVTMDATAGWDAAGSLAADSSFLYVAGVDDYTRDSGGRVRVQKRELASGALVTDFGDAGSIELSFGASAVHSSAEHAMGHGLAIDADHLYLGGTGFGVEKRRLRDGAPAAEFGAAGLARSEAAHDSVATGIALRGGVLYVAGPENGKDVRLEARAADSGELVFAQAENFEDAGCSPQCVAMVAARDDALYLATTTSAGRWRIEKRERAQGALVYAKELAPSGGCDGAMALTVDSLSMYVVGSYEQRWRIEKRSLADGELIQSFGSGGVIDPGIRGAANSIVLRDGILYVAGLEGQRDGVQSSVWRLERRSAEAGLLYSCSGPAVPRAPECASTPRIANAPLSEGPDCIERRVSANACAAASVRVSERASAGEDWTLPEGAAVADGSLASVELSPAEPSSALVLRGFGFDLPDAARVLGVTVHVTRGGEGAVADYRVQLVRDAAILWADRSSSNFWRASDGPVPYGGARDLWGWSWSAQELNDPSFGVALRAQALGATARAQVDAVRVEVHYCE